MAPRSSRVEPGYATRSASCSGCLEGVCVFFLCASVSLLFPLVLTRSLALFVRHTAVHDVPVGVKVVHP